MHGKPLNSKRRLEHLLEAICDIQRFTAGKTAADFLADEILQSAVLMKFSIMGEAIRHVDDTLLLQFSYPWHRVRAMRNLIAHEYFQVKMEAVWAIIENDLAPLKSLVQHMLEDAFKNQ